MRPQSNHAQSNHHELIDSVLVVSYVLWFAVEKNKPWRLYRVNYCYSMGHRRRYREGVAFPSIPSNSPQVQRLRSGF